MSPLVENRSDRRGVGPLTSVSSNVHPHVTPKSNLGQADTQRNGRQHLVLPSDDVQPMGKTINQSQGAITVKKRLST